MRKLIVLTALAVAVGITCSEAPFDPVKARPMPDYVGVGSCEFRKEASVSVAPGSVGDIHFLLRLYGLTDTEPPKHLVCLVQWTEDIFGCVNFTIDEKVSVGAGLIDIRHMGIFIPDVCFTALGPATASEGFELPIGTYTLRFRNGSQVDEYEMIADGKTVTMSAPYSGSYTTYDPSECCGDSVSVVLDSVQARAAY